MTLNLTLIGGILLLLGLLIWGATRYGRRSAEKDSAEKAGEDAAIVAEERSITDRMSDHALEEERKQWQRE